MKARFEESLMKITVIKKSGDVKTMNVCPWVVDVPPVAKS
jgi:hypothetical protein